MRRKGGMDSLRREKVHGTVAPSASFFALSLDNNKELRGHFRAVPDRRIRLSQETATRRWLSLSLLQCDFKDDDYYCATKEKSISTPRGMCANVTKYAESSGWMDHDAQHNSYSCAKVNRPGDRLRNARVKPIIQNNRLGGHKLLISRYYFDQKVRIKKYIKP